MHQNYDQVVGSRYHIYNSLFLNLPFQDILRTGTFLPLFQQYCEKGFEEGKSALEIIDQFFSDLNPAAEKKGVFDLLFNFIQYVERQVALFDSIEDASFEQVNDLRGPGTVSALTMRAKFESKGEKLRQVLDDFSLRIVLTAHPTQFYPGPVLGILTDLEKSIREGDISKINLLLQQLGKTGFINREKPTPFDEAVSLCWYLENIFYYTIPEIIEQLADSLDIPIQNWNNDKLIVIGFWPGGDRDGNPFVNTETTLRVAARLQETVFKCYYRDIRMLRRRLTFKDVDKVIQEIERKIYQRSFGGKTTYNSPSELLSELNQARIIIEQKHNGLFIDLLDNLILKVKIFGFHFASMDVRQDSRKHQLVWDNIIAATGKSAEEVKALPEHDHIESVLKFSENLRTLKIEDEFTNETIKSFLAVGDIQKSNGVEGCHRYVISNCQSALNIIEVYKLGKSLVAEKGNLNLDIVPLFETIDDLAAAPEVMHELFSIKEYREHLKQRGDKQTIMLGFSDGTKDGGYLRANWSIYKAKETLTTVCRENGVTALFFDGRGGPPARGGGNTHDFYASLGDTIETREVQITIQGQTISSNFGRHASCKYNLEQLLSAGLQNNVFDQSQYHLSEPDKRLLEDLADTGYKAYLGLKHHEKFVPYLEKVTPLSFYGESNIGSRPSKRSGSSSLKFEDLRAIPFVGAWAQMKQNIPGFFGVGTAIREFDKAGKKEDLKRLYKSSLFFRTLIGNSMMSLTKSYYPATHYLAEDPEFGEFWQALFNEFQISREEVLDVSGLDELMQNNLSIRSSVRLRERIVLPLIGIQQYAMMHLRYPKDDDKEWEPLYRKLVIRCMFGIINAARNSA